MAEVTHEGTGAPEHGAGFPPFKTETFPGQIFWLAITFAFLFVMLWRVAGPRIKGAIHIRREAINGDIRALVALNKMNGWIQTQTAGDPAKINAGYRLATGKNLGHDTSLAFTAPFAVSAMVNPTNQIWLDKLWRDVASRKIGEDSYFGNSIKMICLIVLSGNWWTPQ